MVITSLVMASLAGCNLLSPVRSEDVSTFVRNENRHIRKGVKSWEEVKRQNIVMQDHEYTCGAASLATLMIYYFGDDVTERQILDVIEKQLPPEEWVEKFTTGLSVRDLMRAARADEFGYQAEARELKLSELLKLTAPVIIHIEQDDFQHFVVFRGFVDDRIFLADPIAGNIRMPVDEFQEIWTGVAMALSKEGVDPGDDHPLAVDKSRSSRPELQVARRSLFLKP